MSPDTRRAVADRSAARVGTSPGHAVLRPRVSWLPRPRRSRGQLRRECAWPAGVARWADSHAHRRPVAPPHARTSTPTRAGNASRPATITRACSTDTTPAVSPAATRNQRESKATASACSARRPGASAWVRDASQAAISRAPSASATSDEAAISRSFSAASRRSASVTASNAAACPHPSCTAAAPRQLHPEQRRSVRRRPRSGAAGASAVRPRSSPPEMLQSYTSSVQNGTVRVHLQESLPWFRGSSLRSSHLNHLGPAPSRCAQPTPSLLQSPFGRNPRRSRGRRHYAASSSRRPSSTRTALCVLG